VKIVIWDVVMLLSLAENTILEEPATSITLGEEKAMQEIRGA
jgi:hypothetical protein